LNIDVIIIVVSRVCLLDDECFCWLKAHGYSTLMQPTWSWRVKYRG